MAELHLCHRVRGRSAGPGRLPWLAARWRPSAALPRWFAMLPHTAHLPACAPPRAADVLVPPRYSDAWWDVQLTKIDAVATTPVAPPLFHVISLEYGAKHAVPASRLRPCWMWEGDRAAWRYNITAGSGTAPHVQTSELTDNRDALADQPTCHIFQFAPGVSRWRNAFYDHAAVALKATARGAADTSN